jgi:hypothetical protein
MSNFWAYALGAVTPVIVLGIVYLVWVLRGAPGGWGP